MKSKNYLEKLKTEAEFIVNKCLSHDFDKLRKLDNQKFFEGKDLKIIGDNLLSKEISKYLEKATSVKVISEENFELISKELYINSIFWLLDPIDGSANLNRDLDHSYISLCLISNKGFPLISVIGSIKDKKIRSCIVENKRIFNDSFKITAHKIALNNLYLASGFPLNFDKKDLHDYVYKLSLFKKVRMYGSAVGSLLMVADKKIDVYYEKGIFSWDVAGALLNVLLKGGDYCVRSLNRKSCTLEVIASSNPEIISSLVNIINNKKIWSRKVVYDY